MLSQLLRLISSQLLQLRLAHFYYLCAAPRLVHLLYELPILLTLHLMVSPPDSQDSAPSSQCS